MSVSESPSVADRRAVAALQRVDIFDAVWRGSMHATLVPRIDIVSGTITSVELLNCLRDPDLGTLVSTQFLPSLNTEQARTLFLCDLAFVQEKLRIGSKETRDLLVDIPADAAALATLGSEVRIIAQHTPDLFRRLELTLEENAITSLSQDQLAQLIDLTRFGLRFSMRSAGNSTNGATGLPLQAVRIDASIVRGVSKSADQMAKLRSLVEHAARIGARVIAEGLDQASDLTVIKREGCGEAQGDVVGRPTGVDDLRSQLAGRNMRTGYRVVSSSR